jgi:hypothetical protein
LLVLLIVATARAADENLPAPVTDPAQVAVHYREVLAQPQFQEPPDASVNDQMKSWLSEWFTRFGTKFEQFRYAQEMPRFAALMTALLVGAAAIALFTTLYRLMRRHQRSDPAGRPERQAGKIFRPPEFYEEELSRAAATGDWHAAWLASWRQFLSRLEQDQLVAADRSRTNREYLTQLRGQPRSAPALTLLGGVVDAYDRFIYGRHAIAEAEWRTFQDQLDEAGLLLHLAGRPAPHSA